MKEKERIRKNDIIRSIAGDSFQGVEIVQDYFERERRENNLEQGYPEEMPELVITDIEMIIRRSDKLMSDLEHKRCPRFTEEYPGSDDKRIYYPSRHITRIEL